jgi:glutathione S-transferase
VKLFFSSTSPYVRKCLATAHELGLADRITLLPSQAHPVNRDARLVAANPLGKVPTLVTGDGQALYDSRVICEYLDHIGGGQLFPKNSTRWNALALQALGDGILDAALLARYEDAARPEALRWADWRSGQIDKVATSLAALEAGTPVLDDTVHIGSITIGCALWYLDLRFGSEIVWRPQHPKLAAWWARFGERPSMQASWALPGA